MSKKVPVRPAPAPRVRRAFLLLAIAIVSCSLLGACGKHAPADARSTGDHPVAVTTTVLQPRPFNDALQALGTAQARESVTITAKVSDVVTRLAFDSGQRVHAGQLLADMNSRAQ